MRENRTSGLTRGKGETNTTLPSLLYCFFVALRDPALPQPVKRHRIVIK